jgi:hypothetical protein
MTFEQWLKTVDEVMLRNYSVTLRDLGAHDDERLERCWRHNDTPLEFVTWFGEKYDLIHNDVARGITRPS